MYTNCATKIGATSYGFFCMLRVTKGDQVSGVHELPQYQGREKEAHAFISLLPSN